MKRVECIQKINRSFELLGNPLRLKIFLKILSEGCDCDINSQSGYTGNCVTGIMKDLNAGGYDPIEIEVLKDYIYKKYGIMMN